MLRSRSAENMSSCGRELTQGLGPLTNINIALATIDRGRHKHSSVANPLSARTWSINNNFYRNPYLELLWLKCYLTWATGLNSYSIKRPKSWLKPSLHAQEQFWALLQNICMTAAAALVTATPLPPPLHPGLHTAILLFFRYQNDIPQMKSPWLHVSLLINFYFKK